ncbi:unnamed protein product [Urochloa humidicola]
MPPDYVEAQHGVYGLQLGRTPTFNLPAGGSAGLPGQSHPPNRQPSNLHQSTSTNGHPSTTTTTCRQSPRQRPNTRAPASYHFPTPSMVWPASSRPKCPNDRTLPSRSTAQQSAHNFHGPPSTGHSLVQACAPNNCNLAGHSFSFGAAATLTSRWAGHHICLLGGFDFHTGSNTHPFLPTLWPS